MVRKKVRKTVIAISDTNDELYLCVFGYKIRKPYKGDEMSVERHKDDTVLITLKSGARTAISTLVLEDTTKSADEFVEEFNKQLAKLV